MGILNVLWACIYCIRRYFVYGLRCSF